MSHERGIEHLQIQLGAVDQLDYMKFVKALAKRNKGKRLAIYCDQLSSHKTPAVLRFLDKKGIEQILAPIYSPDANPIELAFSKVKRKFKQEKLQRLVHGKAMSLNPMIRRAFDTVNVYNVRDYIERASRLLGEMLDG